LVLQGDNEKLPHPRRKIEGGQFRAGNFAQALDPFGPPPAENRASVPMVKRPLTGIGYALDRRSRFVPTRGDRARDFFRHPRETGLS